MSWSGSGLHRCFNLLVGLSMPNVHCDCQCQWDCTYLTSTLRVSYILPHSPLNVKLTLQYEPFVCRQKPNIIVCIMHQGKSESVPESPVFLASLCQHLSQEFPPRFPKESLIGLSYKVWDHVPHTKGHPWNRDEGRIWLKCELSVAE